MVELSILFFAIIGILLIIAGLLELLELWARGRVTESVVLSLIRSKNWATIDDIIVGAHISVDEAWPILEKLLAKGILRVEVRDGKTIYKIA